jgi:CubicO group peptidase (beta-lactamase class C family)
MQKNIWSKLGATSTTFHPELYPETLPQKLEMASRVDIGRGTKSVKPAPIILGQPPKDDLGGIGLWSTPNDFVKLLAALLRGGQPLLTKASVDILFRPQLSDASRAAMPRPLGNQMRRVLGIKSVDEIDQADHCLSGTITLRDIPGRRPRGTVNWSGLPNLHWVRSSHFFSISGTFLTTTSRQPVDRSTNGDYSHTVYSTYATRGCCCDGSVD